MAVLVTVLAGARVTVVKQTVPFLMVPTIQHGYRLQANVYCGISKTHSVNFKTFATFYQYI